MMENGTNLLEMLIQHELAIKNLYESYVVKFPKRHDFWQQLAKDEHKHAVWLGKLHSHPMTDMLLMQNIQVKPQAIKLSIAYIDAQTKKTQKDDVSLMQALSIARDLENALLERQFAKLNNVGPEEIRSILSAIIADTEKHRHQVSVALDEEK